MASHQYFFGGKYDLIQLHRQIIHQNDEKLIEIFTTSTFYLQFKENNENDMTFCYFSCLSQNCFCAHVYGSFVAADARLAS